MENPQIKSKISNLYKIAEKYSADTEKNDEFKLRESIYCYYEHLKSKINKAEKALKNNILDKSLLYIEEAEKKAAEISKLLKKGFPEKIPLVKKTKDTCEIKHNFYEILIKNIKGILLFNLKDKITDFEYADSPVHCRIVYHKNNKKIKSEKLKIENIEVLSEDYNYQVTINIRCDNLMIKHILYVPSYQPLLSEEILIQNRGNSNIDIIELDYGFSKMVGHIEKLNMLSLDGWKFYACNRKRAGKGIGVKEIIISDEIIKFTGKKALIFTDGVRGLLINNLRKNKLNNITLRKKIHRNLLYVVYGGLYYKKSQTASINLLPKKSHIFGRTIYSFYNGDINSALKEYNRILRFSGFK